LLYSAWGHARICLRNKIKQHHHISSIDIYACLLTRSLASSRLARFTSIRFDSIRFESTVHDIAWLAEPLVLHHDQRGVRHEARVGHRLLAVAIGALRKGGREMEAVLQRRHRDVHEVQQVLQRRVGRVATQHSRAVRQTDLDLGDLGARGVGLSQRRDASTLGLELGLSLCTSKLLLSSLLLYSPALDLLQPLE